MSGVGALDACIQVLKKSSLMGLGPQISIRQVIGTSVQSGVVQSSGGELKDAKCLSTMAMHCYDNEYLMYIYDFCESFLKRNNTVRTTITLSFITSKFV